MSLTRTNNRSLWSTLTACLLIGITTTIYFGGIKEFVNYRKSVAPNTMPTMEILRIFTKEYIQRQYLRLISKPLPKATSLASFYIYADEKDLSALISDLPSSAKLQFKPGHIKIGNGNFNSEIQFRYRGGMPLHWLYKKKSLRIKLPPYTTFQGQKSFNLVNPSTLFTITDWISYDLARSLNLLTPDFYPARVFINNNYNGLHYFLDKIDESFLRKNHRMPGSVYSGDTIYISNPFGRDIKGTGQTTFLSKEGEPLMWGDERLWIKEASRNSESTHDRRDIKKFIEIMNETDPLKFMLDFQTYFDKDKYYTFWGLDTLLGSYHHDNFHNHKIYFDPYKGKFEPIEWDIRFWSAHFPSKNMPVNPLLRQVILNPILEFERDKVTYNLLNQFPEQRINKIINDRDTVIRPELEADPYRQYPDGGSTRFSLDKEVPFSMKEYDKAIKELKLTFKNRRKFLKATFEYIKSSFMMESSEEGIKLIISVDGNSPIQFNPWLLIPSDYHDAVDITRIINNEESSISEKNISEILYPGRRINQGNALGRADGWAIMALGKERYVPAPLQYEYKIKGINFSVIESIQELQFVNALTKNKAMMVQVDELPNTEETVSIHPWLIPATDISTTEVILSGEIIISDDQIYSKETLVRILPGTTFKLAKGSSLVFYGKLLAEGTKQKPILFKQNVEGEPWGSIVIQGKAASGSHLNYIHVEGGSITRQRMIDYPGQLNIHDVDSFKLQHCTIRNNFTGDDAVHVAYSHGQISNCHFENTAFDALDMDIVDVTVENSEFVNVGNDALDLMTSNVNINNASIDGAGDKCFSVGEDSEVRIQNSQLYNCNIGIAVKDESQVYVEDLVFKGYHQAAIALYRKNPRYGSGGTIEGKNISGLSNEDIQIDETSINNIDRSTTYFTSSEHSAMKNQPENNE